MRVSNHWTELDVPSSKTFPAQPTGCTQAAKHDWQPSQLIIRERPKQTIGGNLGACEPCRRPTKSPSIYCKQVMDLLAALMRVSFFLFWLTVPFAPGCTVQRRTCDVYTELIRKVTIHGRSPGHRPASLIVVVVYEHQCTYIHPASNGVHESRGDVAGSDTERTVVPVVEIRGPLLFVRRESVPVWLVAF